MELSVIFEAIDARNAADPNQVTGDSDSMPAELIYGQRMTAWLERLYPDASPALQIACRAQHIERWQVPRDSFPEGRTGYLKWRTHLYGFHAERLTDVLTELNCDPELIERAAFLVQKKKLFQDEETAALEDTACLVFLDHYFADFADDYDDGKIISIVQKTWARMTDVGHQAALKLPLNGRVLELVEKALADA